MKTDAKDIFVDPELAGKFAMFHGVLDGTYQLIDELTACIVTLQETGTQDDVENIEAVQDMIKTLDDCIDNINVILKDYSVNNDENLTEGKIMKKKFKAPMSVVHLNKCAGNPIENQKFFNKLNGITLTPQAPDGGSVEASIGMADAGVSAGPAAGEGGAAIGGAAIGGGEGGAL